MLNKVKITLVFIIMLIIILPVSNVYAHTVDDVRDIVGKDRIDETFTESEIAEIVERYNNIERANLIAKMFEMGKSIDVDSETEKEYLALDKEINGLRDKLITDFKSGKATTEVLKSNTELASALYKVSSLKERGVTLEIEYIENKWADDYQKVQEAVEKMSKDFEIGVVGEGLRSPLYSGFVISSPFGFRLDPITKAELTFHNGLDLAADTGDPVMALWNGVVSAIYESETGGKTIEISHGDGLITKYLHLDSISVKVGQVVSQYQVIAGAGNTGTRSMGPHLHLIVELDGEKINPIYLFGSMGLNAFKTYLSYNPDRNRELKDVENNIKYQPTKNEEVVEVKPPRYERSDVDIPEGAIPATAEGNIEINPYNPSETVYKNPNPEKEEAVETPSESDKDNNKE